MSKLALVARTVSTLEITAEAAEQFTAADILAEVEPAVAFKAPKIKLSNDGRRAVFKLAPSASLPIGAMLAGRPVTHAVFKAIELASGKMASLDPTAKQDVNQVAVSKLAPEGK